MDSPAHTDWPPVEARGTRRERGGRGSQRERTAAIKVDDRSSRIASVLALLSGEAPAAVPSWDGHYAFRDRIITTYAAKGKSRSIEGPEAMIDQMHDLCCLTARCADCRVRSICT